MANGIRRTARLAMQADGAEEADDGRRRLDGHFNEAPFRADSFERYRLNTQE